MIINDYMSNYVKAPHILAAEKIKRVWNPLNIFSSRWGNAILSGNNLNLKTNDTSNKLCVK